MSQNAKKRPIFRFKLEKENKQKENDICQTSQLEFLGDKSRGTSLILPKTGVILTFTEMLGDPMKKIKS